MFCISWNHDFTSVLNGEILFMPNYHNFNDFINFNHDPSLETNMGYIVNGRFFPNSIKIKISPMTIPPLVQMGQSNLENTLWVFFSNGFQILQKIVNVVVLGPLDKTF